MDITENDETLNFWESHSGKFLGEITFTQAIQSIVPSPDNYHISVEDYNGIVFLLGVKKE
jgi:hypothetical protein